MLSLGRVLNCCAGGQGGRIWGAGLSSGLKGICCMAIHEGPLHFGGPWGLVTPLHSAVTILNSASDSCSLPLSQGPCLPLHRGGRTFNRKRPVPLPQTHRLPSPAPPSAISALLSESAPHPGPLPTQPSPHHFPCVHKILPKTKPIKPSLGPSPLVANASFLSSFCSQTPQKI